MCVCVSLHVEPILRFKDYVWSCMKIGSVVCLYTPVLPIVPEIEGIHATGGAFTFEDVPLVEFIYTTLYLLTCHTVGYLGLCCCAPCLLSAIISLC